MKTAHELMQIAVKVKREKEEEQRRARELEEEAERKEEEAQAAVIIERFATHALQMAEMGIREGNVCEVPQLHYNLFSVEAHHCRMDRLTGVTKRVADTLASNELQFRLKLRYESGEWQNPISRRTESNPKLFLDAEW